MSEVHLIVVAGGSGTRMGADVPKQFLHIAGQAVLIHTLRAFRRALPQVIPFLVLPKDHHSYWKELYQASGEDLPHELVEGGETRFHSVKNGLSKINSGVVMVHDGVRPLVSALTIQQVLQSAIASEAAIPVVPVHESMRRLGEGSSVAVNRNEFVLVQTPQCFSYALMKKAFEQEYRESFTDCASVVEAYGKPVQLVNGNRENIKITLPSDLIFAEAFLLSQEK